MATQNQGETMKRAILGVLLLPAISVPAPAQLISIRTVPVAQSDQFDIYPSHNLAMGGVSLALRDPLLDPFVNPAKASRVVGGHFYGAPLLFSVTGDAGAGRTLPLAGMFRSGSWFGGVSLAMQEVDPSRRTASPIPVAGQPFIGPVPQLEPAGRSHGNRYAFGAVGRALGTTGMSVALSGRWADLHAIDGVDLLYAGSSEILQGGHAGDLRLGLLKEWGDQRSFELLVLHNRFRMTHDVTFIDRFWDPARQTPVQQARVERNLDYSDAWGIHAGYQRPLSVHGWTVGGVLTANVMSHPKLPNYDVRSVGIIPIPWDPGNSYAFNAGLGFAKTRPASTVALDLVYEPIWTYTWGEAPAAIQTRDGRTIAAGGKTVENWFRFSNVQFRMGVDQKSVPGLGDLLGLQLGLVLHSISYHLDQWDIVQYRGRSQREDWLEWAPTWGLAFRFPDLEIRYRGRVTNGTGRPGASMEFGGGDPRVLSAADVGSNILVAPTGPLTLGEVAVFNHQVSVSVPLR